ncbi:peptidylprolyl isomerase [Exilibacterium tricleocarpae]|uniref:Peptidylprolyl isomerase n=1 Tax=Exilibacterium tricleocarpae TaxID=2591008 RepID=A0A545SQL5_9GAMM|nr:peptidylprolyl isomerase [Exilibacterium tricleocarpae]TQV67251.1 peptidylprolyl isomerase [Exilibacterium tricleocarpae]
MPTTSTASTATSRNRVGPVLHFATGCGDFTVELNAQRAPVTSRYFQALVAAGHYAGSTIYRITTPANDHRGNGGPIRIIQGGLKVGAARSLPALPLEPTSDTGLTHRRWAFSTARFAEDRPYGAFFICMEDSPCLDAGGERNGDGRGFAVCGAVVAGFSTLETIYARAENSDFLQREIPITAVSIHHE